MGGPFETFPFQLGLALAHRRVLKYSFNLYPLSSNNFYLIWDFLHGQETLDGKQSYEARREEDTRLMNDSVLDAGRVTISNSQMTKEKVTRAQIQKDGCLRPNFPSIRDTDFQNWVPQRSSMQAERSWSSNQTR